MPRLHNSIKYGTDILRAFSRVLGLGEEEEGVVRLGETLTPIINLWQLPEAAWIRRETLWATTKFVSAVAGENGFGAIRNSVGSRRIVVIERLRSNVVVNMAIIAIATMQAREASAIRIPVRDSRVPSGFALTQYSTGSGAGTLISATNNMENLQINVPAIAVPVVLHPGFTLFVEHSTVNTAFTVNFAGYERQALPGEIT